MLKMKASIGHLEIADRWKFIFYGISLRKACAGKSSTLQQMGRFLREWKERSKEGMEAKLFLSR